MAYAALTPTPAAYVPAPPVYPTPATLAATIAADANMTPTIQFMMYKHKMATIDKANHVETDMRSMLLVAYHATHKGVPVGKLAVRALMGHLMDTNGKVRAPAL
jgi:hypothetical protein